MKTSSMTFCSCLILCLAFCASVTAGEREPHTPSDGKKVDAVKGSGTLFFRGMGSTDRPGVGPFETVTVGTRALPASLDLSSGMPPVGDQGHQGSCAAWTVGYAIKSYLERVDQGIDITQRNNCMSPAYIYNQVAYTNNSGSSSTTNFGLVGRLGIVPLSSMPYSEDAFLPGAVAPWPTQAQVGEALKNRGAYTGTSSAPTFSFSLSPSDITAIKTKLTEGLPMYLAISVDDTFYNITPTSPFWNPSGTTKGGHAVTIMGYDDTRVNGANVGAFTVQNSWGTNWGNSGRFYVSYATMGTSYVRAVNFCADRLKYKPSITANVKIKHPYRGGVSIIAGVGSTTAPDISFQFYGTSNSFRINGADKTAADVNTVLDLSDFSGFWPPTPTRKWWVRLNDADSDTKIGSITEFFATYNGAVVNTSTTLPVVAPDAGDAFAYLDSGSGTSLPVISVDATTAAASETGPVNGVLTFTRTGDTAAALTVTVNVSGTATNGTDYTQVASTVAFAAGSATTTLTIRPVTDTTAEGSETVIVSIAGGGGYSVGTPSSAQVNISDAPALPTVTILSNPSTASETGPVAGKFVVTRTDPTTAALTVNFTLSGTATLTTDYASPGTSIIIPAGSTSATVTITPVTDSIVDDNETVIATLATNASYTVGAKNSATITIKDAAVVRPVNDNFAARIAITGASGRVTGTNLNATRETSEPTHGGVDESGSVWWTWTATTTGPITISTYGSDFDTTLAIYTGTSAAALTRIVDNDDTGHSLASELVLNTVTGTVYQIAVAGSLVDQGNIVLSINSTLPKVSIATTDAFASDTVPEKGVFRITREGDAALALTVKFTVSGTATPTTDYTALGTSVVIPAGAAGVDLVVNPVKDAIVEAAGETVIVTLASDSNYLISTNNPSVAKVTILDSDTTPPANDNFANAKLLTGSATTVTDAVANYNATREPGEPNHAESDGLSSVWYKFTPAAAATAIITTDGSLDSAKLEMDTVLSVYTGTSFSTLKVVTYNDDYYATDGKYKLTSRVIFPVVAGTTYLVAVDGLGGATGDIKVNFTLSQVPIVSVAVPVTKAYEKDAVPAKFVLSRTGNTDAALTVGYILTGRAQNGFDYMPLPEAVIFAAGAATAELVVTPIDDTEKEGNEFVELTLKTSAAYFASTDADGYGAILIVDDDALPPPNDNFANRIALSTPRPILTTGTNIAATREPGEPRHAGEFGGSSVWWSWTADVTGAIRISTAGSNFDTELGVYTGTGPLLEVASNEDEDYDGFLYTSAVTINAVAGTVYQIAVDGYDGQTGKVCLSITGSTTPIIGVVSESPNANESGTRNGLITLYRSGSTTNALTIPITVTGTATPDVDYKAIPASVTIPAGDRYADIFVVGIDDTLLEGTETVTVTIPATTTGILVAGTGADTVSIMDDELATKKLTFLSPPTATPNPAKAGANVTFVASTNATNPAMNWNFGDATTGTGASAVHVYPATGFFTASVNSSVAPTSQASADVSVLVTTSGAAIEPTYSYFYLNFTKRNLSGQYNITGKFGSGLPTDLSGVTVTLTVAGLKLGSGKLDASGKFSTTTPDRLTFSLASKDGAYSLSYYATNDKLSSALAIYKTTKGGTRTRPVIFPYDVTIQLDGLGSQPFVLTSKLKYSFVKRQYNGSYVK